jgi:hypothetical protein
MTFFPKDLPELISRAWFPLILIDRPYVLLFSEISFTTPSASALAIIYYVSVATPCAISPVNFGKN